MQIQNQLTHLQQYVQYWDNFNLSLLFVLVLVLLHVVGSLYKQPQWKFEQYMKSYRRAALTYGFRFLFVSFVFNLLVSIWI